LWCKVSGLVTEANWKDWKAADFRPYLDVVFEAFGSQRVVYGSDWPVCLLAASYAEQKALLADYIASFSPSEQAAFWGGNGADFYQ
ncbi:MAG: amidohydrolase, partial [Saprospiraceae bacterium]|nr:amidohydrolase [Saprospiraceae bacterium]